MHLEAFLIFATLLAGPATALPRPQGDGSAKQQDNGNLAHDLTVGAVGGAVALGLNQLFNGKNNEKTAAELQQMRNRQELMSDDLQRHDGLFKLSHERITTLEETTKQLRKNVDNVAKKVKLKKPIGRNRRPAAEKSATTEEGLSTEPGARHNLYKMNDEIDAVSKILGSNEALMECILTYYSGGNMVNEPFKGHVDIDRWNVAADQCRHIPGWTEHVKFTQFPGWRIPGGGGLPFRSVAGGLDDKPTPQPFSFKDTKGYHAMKSVFSVFSRPQTEVTPPALGLPSVPAGPVFGY
ncbi:MAG: hypothetical protein M1816_000541 [Peltula sp. TS41687]|nr:MAG: hypothetical protein M1816_000541 [Peltula sp. TS41687]